MGDSPCELIIFWAKKKQQAFFLFRKCLFLFYFLQRVSFGLKKNDPSLWL